MCNESKLIRRAKALLRKTIKDLRRDSQKCPNLACQLLELSDLLAQAEQKLEGKSGGNVAKTLFKLAVTLAQMLQWLLFG